MDLNEPVGRVLARHTPIARQHQISLDGALPEPPLVAEADLTLFEQAVGNMVDNAIRHNRADGHVAVILERRPGGRFCLRVIDDGPGIPAEQLAAVIKRGARGEAARTRAPGGQGLGLHIAYRVSALHDFELSLEPSEYGGLEVAFLGVERSAE
ncbi:sensor histidine kinase [Haliangium ochraceum]|uniref:sensor histidine kinase n=1 Tax=Haliangium ochraceum TaxID=80816 RepID=UPI00019BAB15|nr:sensor histidine kinase [Haliangium ochraceum]